MVDTQANSLSGTIKINNHYFEQGNIHYALDRTFANIPIEQADGVNIVGAISKTESQYQRWIEEMHESMGDTLKAMRRTLPVTGSKFDWSGSSGMRT